MTFTLGVDIACRAPHQASPAAADGGIVWSGHRFRNEIGDLERLWARLPEAARTIAVTVVMEPTRNAWVALAARFRRHGATVVLDPPERSADLRTYHAKHIKSDRLDSVLLARLPLLHPDGRRPLDAIPAAKHVRDARAIHGLFRSSRRIRLRRVRN